MNSYHTIGTEFLYHFFLGNDESVFNLIKGQITITLVIHISKNIPYIKINIIKYMIYCISIGSCFERLIVLCKTCSL